MAVERIEWQCPQCERRYAIPAHLPRPMLCPKCQPAVEEPKPAPVVATSENHPTLSPIPDPPGDDDIELEPLKKGELNAGRFRRKYPALRVISLAYRIMAGLIVLAAVAGFVAGVVGVFQAENEMERMSAVIMGLSSLCGGAFWSITVLAFAELIQLGIDIEQNTRSR